MDEIVKMHQYLDPIHESHIDFIGGFQFQMDEIVKVHQYLIPIHESHI
jgi:hypothetical protein